MAKTKLTELNVEEVSLVDAGANQHAHVTMYKSKNGQPGQGEQQAEKPQSGIRKLFSAIGKALSIPAEDIESAVTDIEKADTFGQKMEQRKLNRITDEIWDVCFALESSLCSIIRDEDVTDKAGLMEQSIDEFTATIKALTASWGSGTPAQIAKNDIPMDHLQETAAHLEEMISKAGCVAKPKVDKEEPKEGEEPPEPEETKKSKEGGNIDMKFNEANMTATDRLAFEDLKKRYGIDEGCGAQTAAAGSEGMEGVAGVAKAAKAVQEPAQGAEGAQAAAGTAPAEADIYKGMNPAVAAMLKSLQERVEKAEEKEMLDVAKKYEIIGQDPQTLAKSLASAKAAGGTAYADMIGVLDSAVAMVEKSGVFGEIGKRGNGTGNNGTDAWSKIEKHAKDLTAADPKLTYAEAIDKACIQHPDLVAEYESNR